MFLEGRTTFYVFRTHNRFGDKYRKKVKEMVVCKDCKKVFTTACPLFLLAIDLEKDYCSRFVFKDEIWKGRKVKEDK